MEKKITKCLVIGGMTIAFWIVCLIISGIVSSRMRLSESAQCEISQTWSNSQNFIGPIICVPEYSDSSKNSPTTCLYVLPETLQADADIASETLHRGIFEASVYRAKVRVNGTFKLNSKSSSSKKGVRYDWSRAQIITGIGDKRGLEEGVAMTIDGEKIELNQYFSDYGNDKIKRLFNAGVRSCSYSEDGAGVTYYNDMDDICQMIDLSDMNDKEITFTLEAHLKGSERINIAPIGRDSQITIRGNSNAPSFVGMMLPSTREVTDSGFVATWKVNSLNRSDVGQTFHSRDAANFDMVGARIMVAGGQYTKIDRALKYAFLVILLSLAGVFVAEMSVRSEINMLNYILIGCALVLFYLMLLSLGEWMGFGWAYGLAALLILGMITLYIKAIVGDGKTALAVCMFMAVIDLFVYVLLGVEDMALLVGTMGLFVVLGVAMFFSLRLNTSTDEVKSISENKE